MANDQHHELLGINEYLNNDQHHELLVINHNLKQIELNTRSIAEDTAWFKRCLQRWAWGTALLVLGGWIWLIGWVAGW